MHNERSNDLSSELIRQVSILDCEVELLAKTLRAIKPDYYRFFMLPIITKSDECARQAGLHPDEIFIENLEPNTHLDEFSVTFGNHYAFDDVSTLYMQRYPGVIAFQNQPSEIFELIQKINYAKSAIVDILASFKLAMLSAGMSSSSLDELTHRFIHEACPRLLTEYAKRKIQIFVEPVTNVYFSMRKDPKVKRFTKDQLLSLLTKQLTLSVEFDKHELTSQVEKDISTIKSSPFKTYVQHCDDYICPTSTIIDAYGNRKNIRALLPFFLFNTELDMLTVGGLKSFCKTQRQTRGKRIDKQLEHPVLERIGIYGK